MKKLIKVACLGLTIVGFTSCSLTRISADKSATGTSIDLLRNGESISIRGVDDDNLKVRVTTKDGKSCDGSFKHMQSYKGYLGFTTPRNEYVGKFTSKSAACKDAVGENAGKEVAFVHIRSGGILSSSMMSSEMVYVCKDKKVLLGLCNPHNTFKVNK